VLTCHSACHPDRRAQDLALGVDKHRHQTYPIDTDREKEGDQRQSKGQTCPVEGVATTSMIMFENAIAGL